MPTQTFTETLVVVTCGECHITFGITAAFQRSRLSDRKVFRCPRGCHISYLGTTDATKAREALKELGEARRTADELRSKLRTTERSEAFYREEATTERRRAAAQKGQRTRVLNLIARGICPVAGCRRNFANVSAHMATEHPDFHSHEEQS